MMNQARLWLSPGDRLIQCRQRQWTGQSANQRPAHHFAREDIQDHGNINKLAAQADLSHIRQPKLIDGLHPNVLGQVGVNGEGMLGIGCHNKLAFANYQQIVTAQNPSDHSFADGHSLPLQEHGDAPVAKSAMFQRLLLNLVADLGFCIGVLLLLPGPVEASPADAAQLAHLFDTCFALLP